MNETGREIPSIDSFNQTAMVIRRHDRNVFGCALYRSGRRGGLFAMNLCLSVCLSLAGIVSKRLH